MATFYSIPDTLYLESKGTEYNLLKYYFLNYNFFTIQYTTITIRQISIVT
jgi:hypothetical protein